MAAEAVSLTGVRETMLGTLYLRALDSRSADPILGDRMAEEAVGRIAYDFGRLRIGGDYASAIATRARPLDEWTRAFLAEHSDATVLHLGCGLDSRVFRVDPPPGVRWFDVDYPDVVELRRRVYPERPGTRTIGSSLTDPRWLDEVPAGGPALVVAEGVLPYLPGAEVEALLRRITTRFGGGVLALDGVSRLAVRLQRLNTVVRRTGATLRWGLDDPRALERRVRGLRLIAERGIDRMYDPRVLARLSRQFRLRVRLAGAVPALRRFVWIARFRF